ncbi:MAG: type III pantothenate kinase [Pseudomonadota bacterium]
MPRTLLLDIGNTRMKWALGADSQLSDFGGTDHGGDPARAIDLLERPGLSTVRIASVMGTASDQKLAEHIRTRWGVSAQFARVEARREGLRVAYAEPQRLGVDRWLMLLALWSELHAPFCVASAGTALTFDAVDANGQHLGGVIAPGLRAMQKATLGATRFETRDLTSPYTKALGTDTEACVRQGALHACAGLIERLGAHATGAKFICGGDAETLSPHLAAGWQHRPYLVLEGLLKL